MIKVVKASRQESPTNVKEDIISRLLHLDKIREKINYRNVKN